MEMPQGTNIRVSRVPVIVMLYDVDFDNFLEL